MRLGIDKIVGRKGEDLIKAIRRLRDEYVHTTGREPNKIEMSYPTFTRIRDHLIDNQIIWTRMNDITCRIDIRIYGMDLEFVDYMEGIEIYHE